MRTFPMVCIAATIVLECFRPLEARAWLDHWNSGVGGKPSRNGLTWERGPTNATVLWRGGFPGDGISQPVTEGNIVVTDRGPVFFPDRRDEVILVAQKLTTGAILWTNTLPFDFPATDWRCHVLGIRDKRVYATRAGDTNPGYLYALGAETGAILWRSQDTVDIYGTESPAFAPNGDLIVGNLLSLLRINSTDGSRRWRTSRVSPSSGSSMPAVFGSRLYGWHGGANAVRLSTFDAATGDLLYSTPILGSFLAETPPFVGPDGTVYAPKASPAGELIAFRDTGTTFVEKWRTSIGDVPYGSYAVGPDGSVYGYSQEYRIIRIRPSDGMILNTSEPSFYPYGVPRMAIDSAGLVFLVCDDQGIPSQGGLYSFNPDLTLRWKESIPRLRGLAIGQAGTLVVGGSETNVIAYRGDSEGLPGPPVKFYREGDGLFIIFSGRLQETDQLPGAWSDVPAANSPWLIAPINPRRFYRSIQE